MSKLKTSLAALALTALPLTCLAGTTPHPPLSLTPFIGGYIFDDAEDVDNSMVAGLRLEYDFTPNFGIEATGAYVPTDTEADMDVDFYRYGLGVIYNVLPGETFNPYVSASFGARTIHPESGGNVTKGIADAGVGLKWQIPNSVAGLRLDLRYLTQVSDYEDNGIDLNNDHPNFEYTLGLVLPLGGEKPAPTPAPKAAPPVAPQDSDGDGVIDAQDKCPDTPAGVKVDATGCPLDSDRDGVTDDLDKCPGTQAGVNVDATGCPLDSDMDGVTDDLDKCPGTPAGVTVDADGCPLDSDRDGVTDDKDKCPGTKAGLTVDRDGCPAMIEEHVKITLNVLFASGKSVVEANYADEIKKVAEFMTDYPDTRTTIEGHTDSVGSAASNKTLSQKRADAVRTYLIDKYGIAGERITAVGYGAERPVADNATEEGRKQNRRIDAVIESTVLKSQE